MAYGVGNGSWVGPCELKMDVGVYTSLVAFAPPSLPSHHHLSVIYVVAHVVCVCCGSCEQTNGGCQRWWLLVEVVTWHH